MLGRRLYSPSLKDVAWLEDARLIFLISHTFVCKFGRVHAVRGGKKVSCVLVCTRVYSFVLVCTRLLLVCYSYVLVCYSHITRMYSCGVLVMIACAICGARAVLDARTKCGARAECANVFAH